MRLDSALYKCTIDIDIDIFEVFTRCRPSPLLWGSFPGRVSQEATESD